jgi:hypothetical protein
MNIWIYNKIKIYFEDQKYNKRYLKCKLDIIHVQLLMIITIFYGFGLWVQTAW